MPPLFNLQDLYQGEDVPTKRQTLHLKVTRILNNSRLSRIDRSLILKVVDEQPALLVRILRQCRWQHYRQLLKPEDLPRFLQQDALVLRRVAEAASTHADVLKYRRQARVLEDISECIGQREDKQKQPGQTKGALGRIVMRAARIGLLDHPYIKMYVQTQQLTINKSLLRKSKIGLEARLRKPIELRDLEIMRLKKNDFSLENISRELVKLGLNPEGKTLKKTGVHRRLARTRRK